MEQQEYCKGDIKQEAVAQLVKQVAKQVVVFTNHMPQVLRYVPKARRKEGGTLFSVWIMEMLGARLPRRIAGPTRAPLKKVSCCQCETDSRRWEDPFCLDLSLIPRPC